MELELSATIQRLNLMIVSGGARGVDQKAHSLCVRLDLPTLVLLPSSLDLMYPQNLSKLKEQILNTGGAFLSEYEPRSSMRKHYFLQRNRLIAALSSHCLVLQASHRGGTMITAKWAIELNRELASLPHAPWSLKASGSNHLIMNGAQMIRDRWDLMTWMGFGAIKTSSQAEQIRY